MGAYKEVSHCTAIDNTPGSICQLTHAPYKYIPTLWVGLLFTVLFVIVFVSHLVLALWPHKFRRGGFMLLAVVCAAGELAGWAARVNSHYNFFQADPYIAQLVALIISPIFISAANYVMLERIIYCVGTELCRCSTKVYIAFFVTGDIVSLVVQAAGGAMSATASTSDGVKHGSNIALAGVLIQVLITGPFLIFLSDFLLRHYRQYRRNQATGRLENRWTRGLVSLAAANYTSSVFILIRCIYRCVEMQEGWTGYLSTHEVYFPIFDAAMIFIALVVFVLFHPSFLLPATWAERSAALDPLGNKASEATTGAAYDMYNYRPHADAARSDSRDAYAIFSDDSPSQSTFKDRYGADKYLSRSSSFVAMPEPAHAQAQPFHADAGSQAALIPYPGSGSHATDAAYYTQQQQQQHDDDPFPSATQLVPPYPPNPQISGYQSPAPMHPEPRDEYYWGRSTRNNPHPDQPRW